MPRGRHSIVPLALVLLVAASFADVTFDPTTGRDPRRYAPDPVVDYQHLKLELDFQDFASRSFTAIETLTFKTLGRPLSVLKLDAIDLRFNTVTDLNGAALPFSSDGEKLSVRFPTPLAPYSDSGLIIRYECRDPTNGMTFALPDDAYSERALTIHTQNESEYARYWFACHDSPNERLTSETITSVPARYSVISNGRLVERKELGDGRVRWHYQLEQPVPAYLVSLVIGDLEVVRQSWRDIPVEYWVPAKCKDDALRTFGKTPKMIETYSRLLDFPYPFAKYSQAAVYLFQWGGMENASCTTLYEECTLDEKAAVDQDLEGLISHELAHQWFGDVVTCRDWSHIWLNEGLATYMEYAWYEAEYGPDRYDYSVWNELRGVAEGERADPHGGLTFAYWSRPDDVFGRSPSNPYSKGASVMHMLRRRVGDGVFWAGLQDYLKQHAWTLVEADDLRRAFEARSGLSLDRFFQQWVRRAGAPRLRVEYAWNDERREATFTVTQTQEINEAAPAFAFDLDIWLVGADGQIDQRVLSSDQRTTTLLAPASAEPQQVIVDPLASLLAVYELKLPARMLEKTALSGPTLVSRLHTVRALRVENSDSAREALATVLRDEAAFWGLREQAAHSLGDMQQPAARDLLLAAIEAGIRDPRVRRPALDAIARYRDPQVAQLLLRYAKGDESYAVEAAASRGLGGQEATGEIVEALLVNAKKRSRDDQVRLAAIDALASLGDGRAFSAAMELARYGERAPSRPSGIHALAQLDLDDEQHEAARELLVSLLDDPQEGAVNAAIAALGELGDEEAIPALEKLAGGAGLEDRRSAARAAIDAIHREAGESRSTRDLRERVRKLEDFRREMERSKERA